MSQRTGKQSVPLTLAGAVLLCVSSIVRAGAQPASHVLILHSFGRDYSPHNVLSSAFRSGLTSRSEGTVEFFETSIQATQLGGLRADEPLLDYLASFYAPHKPDLIVSFAGPAARFCLQHRDRLFPDVPLLVGGLDIRHLKDAALGPNDAYVAVRLEGGKIIETALQVLPGTTHVAVVLGASPNELYWANELQREFTVFENRLSFIWLTGMSLAQVQQGVAGLPAQSVVFYVSLLCDSAGVTYENHQALAAVKSSAAVPVFGVFEDQLGEGVVGGPVCSPRQIGEQAAQAAHRILRGQHPAAIRTTTAAQGIPIFDWRELQRWQISEDRLPTGSKILFRQPSPWETYRTPLLAGAGIVGLQTALLIMLLLSKTRRRNAEAESRALAGRILTAHEDERCRLARELHDDITQRLACLAIDASLLERRPAGGRDQRADSASIQQGLARLSEDVHALSYRLHPSILDDLGLPAALQAECDEFSARESVPVHFSHVGLPAKTPQEAALCLYRVAQAALRNVARHARASGVEVSLQRHNGGLQLAVVDDGVGFDPVQQPHRPSIGHASMRERVHLVGGRLEIESEPGHGTTVLAWIPLNGASS